MVFIDCSVMERTICDGCSQEFPSKSELTRHIVKYQGTCNPNKIGKFAKFFFLYSTNPFYSSLSAFSIFFIFLLILFGKFIVNCPFSFFHLLHKFKF